MPVDANIQAHQIGDGSVFDRTAQNMATGENTRFISPFLDPELTRKPEYYVYVYSVVDPRPDGKHLMRNCPPLIRHLRIAELKSGERYTLVTKFAHPVNQPDVDATDQRINHAHNAQRVAQDVVNPENTTMDQDASLAPEHSFAEGNDYGKLGVFWSLNSPPKDEEVAKAIARKERFYRARLDQCRALEASDPKSLYAYLTTTDHVAADYFGEEFSWHKVTRKPAACPNCQEPIKAGAAYHRNADGVLCVIDWQRTVEAGVKQMEDVPLSKRWDTEQEPKTSRSSRKAKGTQSES